MPLMALFAYVASLVFLPASMSGRNHLALPGRGDGPVQPPAEAELLHRREVSSDDELIALLAGYIDRFYNLRRLHSSLGYHSPVEFEQLVSS